MTSQMTSVLLLCKTVTIETEKKNKLCFVFFTTADQLIDSGVIPGCSSAY